MNDRQRGRFVTGRDVPAEPLVEQAAADAVVRRGEVEVAAATYLVYYGNHIANEEEQILQLAGQTLSEADWKAAKDAAPAGHDPLLGAHPEERFRELRRRIAEQQALLDVLPIGIGIATDRECREMRVNRALAATLGIAVEGNGSGRISWQFDSWQWLSLALAGPVVFWGGWPFHRAAWLNLRHAAASMDTLISLGTLAAFAWSLWALFIGEAGDPASGCGLVLARGHRDLLWRRRP